MKKIIYNSRIWSFYYEPKIIDDMVLNEDIRKRFKKFVDEIPNIMLYGSPGIGKGTFAHILLEQTKLPKLWINASDETGIDAMRDKVRSFATAMGSHGDLKIVVLNEGDSLTSGMQGSQKMLRQLMEDVQKITRFILLCNYDRYIIPELRSRFTTLKVENPPKSDIAKFCLKILKSEKIKLTKETVTHIKTIVEKCYPDIRKTVNVLQENCIDGILGGSRLSASEGIWDKVLKGIVSQDLENVRQILKSNYIDYNELYNYLFENAGIFKEPGGAILLIGEHLHRNTISDIKEINFMHMVVDMVYKKVI